MKRRLQDPNGLYSERAVHFAHALSGLRGQVPKPQTSVSSFSKLEVGFVLFGVRAEGSGFWS